MSFEQVAARAIEYAEQGFPLRDRTAQAIQREIRFIEQWPDNRRYWLKPDGSYYQAGETIRLPTLANTLNRMVEAERANRHNAREAGIVAARDRFYAGDIAEEMVEFSESKRCAFRLFPISPSSTLASRNRSRRPTRAIRSISSRSTARARLLLQALNILEQLRSPVDGSQ